MSLWMQAWARLRGDRVGMVSLYVVLAFFVLVLLAQLGLIAGSWQKEVGVPFAPPSIVGAQATQASAALAPQLPNVDLSDVDPLAPRYKEWDERASKVKTEVSVKAAT